MAIKILLWTVGSIAAAIAALFAALYWRQESLLFAPVKLPADFTLSEQGVSELSIPVDGATLSGFQLRLPNPKGVVFFLHGNAGNLASWFVDTDFYRRANFDLVMIDYRGYGKSTGHIQSEAQLRADVAAAWNTVAPRYRGRRVVLLGRSLGTALAAGLAARIHPDLTILVSPYWSMRDMAALHYPWVPAALLRYSLETWRDVAAIDTPLLLLHGDRDGLIPYSHSERLLAVAPSGHMVLVPGAAHNDLQDFAVYRDAIVQRLDALP
jgi:pimeloyl-ACP methyl ester carboxylesterase